MAVELETEEMCQVLVNPQVKDWTRSARHLLWVTTQHSHASGACWHHVSPECSWWHLSGQINSPSTQLNPCGQQGSMLAELDRLFNWFSLPSWWIYLLYSAIMWISFSGICTYTNAFPCTVEGGVYSGVFRNKVDLTGMLEVNSLTSAGMVLTSSDSWEASSYIMGWDFRDLGNIKTIF